MKTQEEKEERQEKRKTLLIVLIAAVVGAAFIAWIIASNIDTNKYTYSDDDRAYKVVVDNDVPADDPGDEEVVSASSISYEPDKSVETGEKGIIHEQFQTTDDSGEARTVYIIYAKDNISEHDIYDIIGRAGKIIRIEQAQGDNSGSEDGNTERNSTVTPTGNAATTVSPSPAQLTQQDTKTADRNASKNSAITDNDTNGNMQNNSGNASQHLSDSNHDGIENNQNTTPVPAHPDTGKETDDDAKRTSETVVRIPDSSDATVRLSCRSSNLKCTISVLNGSVTNIDRVTWHISGASIKEDDIKTSATLTPDDNPCKINAYVEVRFTDGTIVKSNKIFVRINKKGKRVVIPEKYLSSLGMYQLKASDKKELEQEIK